MYMQKSKFICYNQIFNKSYESSLNIVNIMTKLTKLGAQVFSQNIYLVYLRHLLYTYIFLKASVNTSKYYQIFVFNVHITNTENESLITRI